MIMKTGRLRMKKILIIIVLFSFTTASTAFADARMDFNAKCAACHRTNKAILKKAKMLNVEPGKLALMASKMSRDEMIAITEKGKDKMPGFEKEMTKDQIISVIDYIIAFKNKAGRK
jgi:mono/diheme cytochrome c family protein